MPYAAVHRGAYLQRGESVSLIHALFYGPSLVDQPCKLKFNVRVRETGQPCKFYFNVREIISCFSCKKMEYTHGGSIRVGNGIGEAL